MANAGNPQNTATPVATGAQGPNVFNQSAGAYGNATQVVNNTMNDLERTRQMQQNQMGASASAANAFGGSRHGIADAETNLGFGRQAADTAAQLRLGGYNQALNSAAQDVKFGYQGRDIQNDQAKQGLQQQIMNQALIDSAGQQYQGYINSPQMAQSSFGDYLNTSSLGQQSVTGTEDAGLFKYISMAADLGLF